MPQLWTEFTAAARQGRSLHLPMPGGRAYPLADLLERAERTAASVLERLGGRPPRRLGVLMNNGEPWVRGALCAFRLDAAIVPLPLAVGFAGADAYSAHLARIARTAALDAILVDDSLGPAIARRVARDLTELPFIDVTDPGDRPAPPSVPEPAGADDQGLAVIQYTSGSTSAPKGVALTHANVSAGLAAVTTGLGFTDQDAFGVWIPMFHDMGLFSVLSGLARGTDVCLWRPSDFVRRPLTWLAGFAASPATVLPAPNFCFDLLVSAARQDPPRSLDLSGWRIASNGAEPVRRRTLEAFQETFGPYGFRAAAMEPVYGMAEATLVVTTSDPAGVWHALTVDRDRLGTGDTVRVVGDADPGARSVVACGRPAAGIRLRIAAPDTADTTGSAVAGAGVVGEVQITGPAVTSGYLDLPADQQPFTPDGWLRTGDLGFLDGELYLVGRLKAMITVRGQNYYAEDVEEIVRTTPGMDRPRTAAIAWTEDEGERMVVLCESALDPAEARLLARAAQDQVRRQLGLDEVDIIPVAPAAIPHTTSGKVQRHAALSLYRTLRTAAGPAGSPGPGDGADPDPAKKR
ncbi:MAG TPA: AMP-binding protein [Actinocrinis sp.]|nr:AMP-binding protein [Actinocrinis sp.]